jgi:hypothetical protein
MIDTSPILIEGKKMNISNGLNLINHAQQRSENAAKEIAGLYIQKTDTGATEYKSDSLIKPVLDLKRAELETASAAKIIETEQKMIGSILDIKA